MLNNEIMSKQLEIPVELCEFLKLTFKLIETRSIVYEGNGIKYEVRLKENGHNRPHIHASYGEYNVSISIDNNVEVIAGNLPHKQNKIVIEFVKNNLNKFRTKWNKYHVDCILPMTNTAFKYDEM